MVPGFVRGSSLQREKKKRKAPALFPTRLIESSETRRAAICQSVAHMEGKNNSASETKELLMRLTMLRQDI